MFGTTFEKEDIDAWVEAQTASYKDWSSEEDKYAGNKKRFNIKKTIESEEFETNKHFKEMGSYSKLNEYLENQLAKKELEYKQRFTDEKNKELLKRQEVEVKLSLDTRNKFVFDYNSKLREQAVTVRDNYLNSFMQEHLDEIGNGEAWSKELKNEYKIGLNNELKEHGLDKMISYAKIVNNELKYVDSDGKDKNGYKFSVGNDISNHYFNNTDDKYLFNKFKGTVTNKFNAKNPNLTYEEWVKQQKNSRYDSRFEAIFSEEANNSEYEGLIDPKEQNLALRYNILENSGVIVTTEGNKINWGETQNAINSMVDSVKKTTLQNAFKGFEKAAEGADLNELKTRFKYHELSEGQQAITVLDAIGKKIENGLIDLAKGKAEGIVEINGINFNEKQLKLLNERYKEGYEAKLNSIQEKAESILVLKLLNSSNFSKNTMSKFITTMNNLEGMNPDLKEIAGNLQKALEQSPDGNSNEVKKYMNQFNKYQGDIVKIVRENSTDFRGVLGSIRYGSKLHQLDKFLGKRTREAMGVINTEHAAMPKNEAMSINSFNNSVKNDIKSLLSNVKTRYRTPGKLQTLEDAYDWLDIAGHDDGGYKSNNDDVNEKVINLFSKDIASLFFKVAGELAYYSSSKKVAGFTKSNGIDSGDVDDLKKNLSILVNGTNNLEVKENLKNIKNAIDVADRLTNSTGNLFHLSARNNSARSDKTLCYTEGCGSDGKKHYVGPAYSSNMSTEKEKLKAIDSFNYALSDIIVLQQAMNSGLYSTEYTNEYSDRIQQAKQHIKKSLKNGFLQMGYDNEEKVAAFHREALYRLINMEKYSQDLAGVKFKIAVSSGDSFSGTDISVDPNKIFSKQLNDYNKALITGNSKKFEKIKEKYNANGDIFISPLDSSSKQFKGLYLWDSIMFNNTGGINKANVQRVYNEIDKLKKENKNNTNLVKKYKMIQKLLDSYKSSKVGKRLVPGLASIKYYSEVLADVIDSMETTNEKKIVKKFPKKLMKGLLNLENIQLKLRNADKDVIPKNFDIGDFTAK
jgi:hypothetical protein